MHIVEIKLSGTLGATARWQRQALPCPAALKITFCKANLSSHQVWIQNLVNCGSVFAVIKSNPTFNCVTFNLIKAGSKLGFEIISGTSCKNWGTALSCRLYGAAPVQQRKALWRQWRDGGGDTIIWLFLPASIRNTTTKHTVNMRRGNYFKVYKRSLRQQRL